MWNVKRQVDVNARYFGTVIFYHKYRGYGFLGKSPSGCWTLMMISISDRCAKGSNCGSPFSIAKVPWNLIGYCSYTYNTRLHVFSKEKHEKAQVLSNSHNLMHIFCCEHVFSIIKNETPKAPSKVHWANGNWNPHRKGGIRRSPKWMGMTVQHGPMRWHYGG